MRRLVDTRRRAARATLVVLMLAAAVVVAAPPTAAQSSGSSGGTADKNLTVVNYNILHGIFCPSDTDNCRAPDRVALFLSHNPQVVDASCNLGMVRAEARLINLQCAFKVGAGSGQVSLCQNYTPQVVH